MEELKKKVYDILRPPVATLASAVGDRANELPLAGLFIAGMGALRFPLTQAEAERLASCTSARTETCTYLVASVSASPSWTSAINALGARVAKSLDFSEPLVVRFNCLVLHRSVFSPKCHHSEAVSRFNDDSRVSATLRVMLPAKYSGGSQTYSRAGSSYTFNFDSRAADAFHYVAARNDCSLKVTPITSGFCVFAEYHMVAKSEEHLFANNEPRNHVKQVIEVAKEWKKLMAEGIGTTKLFLPLNQEATGAVVSSTSAKSVMNVLCDRDSFALQLLHQSDMFEVVFARIERYVFGSPSDSSSRVTKRRRLHETRTETIQHEMETIRKQWINVKRCQHLPKGSNTPFPLYFEEQNAKNSVDSVEASSEKKRGPFSLNGLRKLVFLQIDVKAEKVGTGNICESKPMKENYREYLLNGRTRKSVKHWYRGFVLIFWPRSASFRIACETNLFGAVKYLSEKVCDHQIKAKEELCAALDVTERGVSKNNYPLFQLKRATALRLLGTATSLRDQSSAIRALNLIGKRSLLIAQPFPSQDVFAEILLNVTHTFGFDQMRESLKCIVDSVAPKSINLLVPIVDRFDSSLLSEQSTISKELIQKNKKKYVRSEVPKQFALCSKRKEVIQLTMLFANHIAEHITPEFCFRRHMISIGTRANNRLVDRLVQEIGGMSRARLIELAGLLCTLGNDKDLPYSLIFSVAAAFVVVVSQRNGATDTCIHNSTGRDIGTAMWKWLLSANPRPHSLLQSFVSVMSERPTMLSTMVATRSDWISDEYMRLAVRHRVKHLKVLQKPKQTWNFQNAKAIDYHPGVTAFLRGPERAMRYGGNHKFSSVAEAKRLENVLTAGEDRRFWVYARAHSGAVRTDAFIDIVKKDVPFQSSLKTYTEAQSEIAELRSWLVRTSHLRGSAQVNTDSLA